MKGAETIKKMRDLSVDELRAQETEMKEKLFRFRFQLAMGQTETLNKLRGLRKDRARVLTVIREKEKA